MALTLFTSNALAIAAVRSRLSFHLRRSFSSVATNAASNQMAKVGVVQMTSTNDLEANFQTCSRLVKEAAAEGVKLLCFPESFSFIGARMGESIEIAEPLDGPTMQRYCSLAREANIWLSLGGFQEKGPDDAHLCNTHVLLDNYGKIRNSYRKIHLFDVDVPGNMVYKESSFTSQGDTVVAEDSPIGRLGLTVCYDLRFPELYQMLRFHYQAQVLLVPSAFTKVTGEAHWEILLLARAIETQCYVIAAAQAGKHNEKRESYGDSIIIDPWGTVIARLPGSHISLVAFCDVLLCDYRMLTCHYPISVPDRLCTGFAVAEIDLSKIDTVRTKMPISMHRVLDSCWKSSSL
ncbi:Nitrilase-like protein 2 [Rhynchospora pubera]|uniref:Nitrilase-like protein 2 n=1 Tax=Rhynchospora pubera TaxID=906938 RepID=A0AAV8ELD4_9POAL|nr:Nitrilase-like protein 2 [Rhynchospora pubera]